ncbi:unnamed protein product [Cylindrotheca closterium]|uniref:CS domain-containing protein n=1 Tax=Cylindrotheca closterium TaxID=2856 RepID=A0AAD2FF66_9STRA|nr:unnamed protein product [Cylindrotheca closterium]
MSTFRFSWRFAVLVAFVCISSSLAQGLPFLIFNGKVENDIGEPIPGAQVQFWHTDTEGNYNHPNAGEIPLDPNFQYYGTATTDDSGDFQFLTRRPGIYLSRPVTHIHFKVWLDGADVFTSQFYFRDENTSFNEMLILDLVEATDMVGDSVIPTFSTNKTIVLDRGLGGSGPFTPRQGAGPFYPREDFFSLGSILIDITADEQPGTPEPSAAPVAPTIQTRAPSSSSPVSNDVFSTAPSVTTTTTDETSFSVISCQRKFLSINKHGANFFSFRIPKIKRLLTGKEATKIMTEEEKELTPEERMQWLRDRGILIETPEERKWQSEAEATKSSSSAPTETVSYVLVPADSNLPMQELTFESSQDVGGDGLLEHVKPTFAKDSKKVDLSLLQQPSPMQMGSSSPGNVSEDALKKVAQDGQVEIFNLVHPTPSNKFVGINIYLDEIGLLKRLPLNNRASDFARDVGYNPPPQFYGDVFLGRVHRRGAILIRNISFVLNDTIPNADWLQQGATQNLEYQMEMNQITGRQETQTEVAGSNGVASQEVGYTWTQTEEEVEVVAPLPNADIKTKDIKIKFKPRQIEIYCQGEKRLSFEIFEKVDVDGCTWTIDKVNGQSSIVVTMEKMDEALWPRIEN